MKQKPRATVYLIALSLNQTKTRTAFLTRVRFSSAGFALAVDRVNVHSNKLESFSSRALFGAGRVGATWA
jgi:hypothetical protein